jgi:glycosyltransferase involved in cell wall biosynthesis
MLQDNTYASVSVIIPGYNCSQTIERALRSVASQTLKPYEVIFVDDKSQDRTLEVLYELQQELGNEWLKIIQLEKNSGPSVARNAGWSLANSDYIAFLDADDSWHPQKIEIQYQWMMNHSECVLTGHLIALDSDKNSRAAALVSNFQVLPIKKTAFLLKNRFSTPTVMLKRTINLRFDSEQRFAEDYLLWLKVISTYSNVFIIRHELAYIHKAAYGQGGLSEQLWEMEKGELQTYKKIQADGFINQFVYYFLVAFSLAKYVRRLLLAGFKINASNP